MLHFVQRARRKVKYFQYLFDYIDNLSMQTSFKKILVIRKMLKVQISENPHGHDFYHFKIYDGWLLKTASATYSWFWCTGQVKYVQRYMYAVHVIRSWLIHQLNIYSNGNGYQPPWMDCHTLPLTRVLMCTDALLLHYLLFIQMYSDFTYLGMEALQRKSQSKRFTWAWRGVLISNVDIPHMELVSK